MRAVIFNFTGTARGSNLTAVRQVAFCHPAGWPVTKIGHWPITKRSILSLILLFLPSSLVSLL